MPGKRRSVTFMGNGLDLAGPESFDPIPLRREGEASDAIKQAPHGQVHPMDIPIPSVGESSMDWISSMLTLRTGTGRDAPPSPFSVPPHAGA